MRAEAGRLRTTSLRLRTVVAIVVLLAVLLAGLTIAVEGLLGVRLRAQAEDRLRDRASAAAALVGTVDAEDLADRLSAQGLSVRIVQPDGDAVEAGPTPDQLRAGPLDPGSLPVTIPRGSGGRRTDTHRSGHAGARRRRRHDHVVVGSRGRRCPHPGEPARRRHPDHPHRRHP
ncbi:hypothetical protein WDV91_10520 [Curtobacterium flaccumfaciens pv. flaccumfaciens]